ncbi:MAG: hypothetical protein PF694_11010 [Bacteroidetes bacterium]|jgi:hypothetical protein|nr:hypothetical protein [Bacteroidota bacterium]
MKKIILKLSLITILSLTSTALLAQGPPDPPGDPGSGGGPVGGSAPIGGGIAILLSLGAAYGGRKVYKYWQSQKEDLEE